MPHDLNSSVPAGAIVVVEGLIHLRHGLEGTSVIRSERSNGRMSWLYYSCSEYSSNIAGLPAEIFV